MIIVTGASGFLGGAISGSFGGAAINISRSLTDGPNNTQMDLSNREHVAKFIARESGSEVSHLVHCAGVTPGRKASDFAVDLEMAENVARICQELKVPTLVSISAWVVYEPRAQPPVSEAAALVPNTAYGESKLAVERCFKDRLDRTVVMNLRASSIYGPGQRSVGLIPNLVKSAEQVGIMTIDSVDTKRDYLYIEDFTRAVNSALRVTTDSNIDINLGGGQSKSVREVSELVADVFSRSHGKDVAIQVKQPLKDSTPLDNELAIDEARLLGLIRSTTDFRRGLERYIAWTRREHLF